MRLRLLVVLLLIVSLSGEACAQGSLTIPNTFAGKALGPLGQLDANWAAIADYVNARELVVNTLANRPAAGVKGRLYLAADENGGTLYEDTGTAWTQIAGNLGLRNVKTFGAKCDGVTDDTAAITLAIGKVTSDGTNPNRIVFFPPGSCKTTSTLEVPPNTILRGTNRYSTTIVASEGQASTLSCAFNGACVRLVRRNTTAGSLWHMGGVEDLSFTGSDSFGVPSTTAFRFIELGDPTSVTTSTGAWTTWVRRCTFNNAPGGYGIYAAHSQDNTAELNWFNSVKFPIYYNTVISTAKILNNYFLDQTGIAGAIAMQFRPGTLGGSAGGPLIVGNYTLGYQYAVWNTSIIGMTIRDNIFEGTYQTPIYQTAYLSDQTTQDGTGPVAGAIEGNTFINWGAAGTDVPAIQLSYTQKSWVGTNAYQSPNGAVVTAMLNWSDNACSPQCTQNNLVIEPACSGNNCTGLAGVVKNATVTTQNAVIGRAFLQPQSVAGDLSTSGFGGGEAGRQWFDTTNKRYRWWDGATIQTVIAGLAPVTQQVLYGTTNSLATSSANLFYDGTALHVQNGSIPFYVQADATHQLFLYHSLTNAYLATLQSFPLTLRTNNTDALTIGTSQGVQVGTPTGGDKGVGTINLAATTPIYSNGNAIFSTGTPTCGTGCATIVTNSMDSWGAMTASAATSAAVAWSHTLNRAPFCTVSDNSTTQFSDVSAVSTTGLTVTFAAAFTGTIYWNCGGAG